jgi:hypothetical protein
MCRHYLCHIHPPIPFPNISPHLQSILLHYSEDGLFKLFTWVGFEP